MELQFQQKTKEKESGYQQELTQQRTQMEAQFLSEQQTKDSRIKELIKKNKVLQGLVLQPMPSTSS
ncbi:MAG: hypothetical protein ACR2PX_15115 [Endozoicomonas sp.]|uniref:hypothetical protein n=1 Tax=Endozoicomonas sp. TaxID=1892382 RepID=UPI003D9B9FBD